MIDGPHPISPHHTPAHALERLIFFSDAVFAISITLLVIELHAPALDPGASDWRMIAALVRLTPELIAVVVSFLVIGAFWVGHHRAFDCARHWSSRLFLPNILLLFAVAFMPFFTAFLSNNPGQRVPTVAYCGWLLLIALLNLWVQAVATAPPVAADDLPPGRVRSLHHRGWGVAAGAATALLIAFVQPWIAQPALLTMPLYRRLIDRLTRPRPTPSADLPSHPDAVSPPPTI